MELSNLHPMFIPLLLMAMIAPIGGIDMIYYHIYKFRLYMQPSAKKETATHLIRGLIFSIGLVLLFHYEPHGTWFWFLSALFILDFFNSLIDVFLEPASRAPLGGLPRMEYLIHTIGSTFDGGITAAFLIFGWKYHSDSTALTPIADSALPNWLRIQKYFLIPSAFGLTLLESALFARTRLCKYRGSSTTTKTP